MLTELGEQLWRACSADACIGPGFSIRPLYIAHPRPLPPRTGHVWRPGDAAYLIDRELHEPEALTLLTDTTLPDGIERRARDGLIVIACAGSKDAAVFARQLGELERWIGTVLSLPVADGFTADGDRMIEVLERADAAPFTFYDPSTATAYQALLGDEHELHDAARRVDGQAIQGVVFVFPDRAAALRYRDVLLDRAATTTAYIDERGVLWDPAPPGDWLR